jgi:flagellar hook-length control protein FliK
MDITALLGTTPQLTAQASPTAEGTDSSSFAQNLSEASDRQAATANSAPAVASQTNKPVAPQPAAQQQATQPAPAQNGDAAPSQATPQETQQSSAVALADDPATDAALPTDAQILTTELPESLPTAATAPQPVVVQSAPQPKPAIKPATQAAVEEETADIEPVDTPVSAPALDDELDVQTDSDTQLQQIRDRMHLIDNAGNPDISSATPNYVPITPSMPVSVEAAPQASEPQSPQVATAVSQNISALIKDTSSTDTQASVELDITPQQTRTAQTEQVSADISDDASVSTAQADTPDLAPAADNLSTTWNPASFAFADAASITANSPVLTAAVGSAQWQTGLSQQILGLHQRGQQQVDLQLHPADLGPLSISLKIDDNGTQAQFISAHPAVRSAVEQAIPHLREALASQGIALGQTSVSDQSSRQARDDQASGQFSSSGQSSRQTPDQSQDSFDPEPDHEPGLSPLSGRVDVYT